MRFEESKELKEGSKEEGKEKSSHPRTTVERTVRFPLRSRSQSMCVMSVDGSPLPDRFQCMNHQKGEFRNKERKGEEGRKEGE